MAIACVEHMHPMLSAMFCMLRMSKRKHKCLGTLQRITLQ